MCKTTLQVVHFKNYIFSKDVKQFFLKNYFFLNCIFTLMPKLTKGCIKQAFCLCVNTKTDAATTFVKRAATTFQLEFPSLKLMQNIYVGIPHTGDLGAGEQAAWQIRHKVSCQIVQ